MVREVPHASILDVGPGRGKGGVLLREYLAGVERLEAIEGWEPYVTARLRCIYDRVHVADVMAPWIDARWLGEFDVVLMVDVFEHLARADALALLERIAGSVVICTPAAWFQNPEARTIWTEAHRSLWSVEDFQAMPRAEVAYVNEWGAVLARLGPGRTS